MRYKRLFLFLIEELLVAPLQVLLTSDNKLFNRFWLSAGIIFCVYRCDYLRQ